MDAIAIDHVNLQIPDDRFDELREFYEDRLGFDIEGLAAYRDGEAGVFSVRLGPGCLVHVSPVDPDSFVPPGGNYNHVAVRVGLSAGELRERLDGAGVEVLTEADRRGATGVQRAFYVEDPFGYTVELKATDTGGS